MHKHKETESRSVASRAPGQKMGARIERMANEYGAILRGDKMFWNFRAVIDIQICKSTKNH